MASRSLRQRTKAALLTHADLVEKLREMGVEENQPNIRNKIARGGFTAVFLIQCLTAIGAHTIHLHGG
jgi:hypothetical protein